MKLGKYNNFSDFLTTLSSAGELLEIPEEIDTELEITQFADFEMKSKSGGKALLFKNPILDGKISEFPVAINTMGSWHRMAIALRQKSVSVLEKEIGKIFHAKPPKNLKSTLELVQIGSNLRHLRPKNVRKAPCQEVCHIYETNPLENFTDIKSVETAWQNFTKTNQEHFSLKNLPILKCWPYDGGRFITLPCVHTIDPETGTRNVGMYRMQVFSELLAGMHWQTQKVARRHSNVYRKRGQPMPVAITIGGDPAYTFSATAPLPDGIDELQLSAFIRKKRIPLVKCKTVPLTVPADVDFVIEGVVDPNKTLPEGPFGDHTGFYTEQAEYPFIKISAITHMRKAIYPTTIVGIPPMEDFYIGSASVRIFMPILKSTFPEIVDIALPAEGVFHNLLFVSIKKQYPLHAHKIIHGLWGMGQMMFSKYIIVVDDDCDVQNTSEVLFTLGANTDPGRDCVFAKLPSDSLDHATSIRDVGTHLGIDATKKMPAEGYQRPHPWPEKVSMPNKIINKVKAIRDKYA